MGSAAIARPCQWVETGLSANLQQLTTIYRISLDRCSSTMRYDKLFNALTTLVRQHFGSAQLRYS